MAKELGLLLGMLQEWHGQIVIGILLWVHLYPILLHVTLGMEIMDLGLVIKDSMAVHVFLTQTLKIQPGFVNKITHLGLRVKILAPINNLSKCHKVLGQPIQTSHLRVQIRAVLIHGEN